MFPNITFQHGIIKHHIASYLKCHDCRYNESCWKSTLKYLDRHITASIVAKPHIWNSMAFLKDTVTNITFDENDSYVQCFWYVIHNCIHPFVKILNNSQEWSESFNYEFLYPWRVLPTYRKGKNLTSLFNLFWFRLP